MIKDFDELNTYPEYPELEIVEEFANYVLDNSISEMRKETLKKLLILGDKQYHTYSQPSIELKQRIQKWIINNWTENTNEFLSDILSILYCFALDKTIFEKALNLIQVDQNYQNHEKEKDMKTLQNSDVNNINPWWDLKNSIIEFLVKRDLKTAHNKA